MKNKFDVMADEADKFVDAINSVPGPTDQLIISGLRNDYDVIASEAVDWIISKCRLSDFIEEIIACVRRSASYLIRGRARIVAALADNEELRLFLKGSQGDLDAYYAVWDAAARYIETNDSKELKMLKEYARSDDMSISSLSKSLIRFVIRNSRR
ncbi:hypothetical protein [Rhizorhabdus sp. FW153]|uniref:hypothetical protein n=1 Tax=Rhizorhabdus sp. FW153 TaxID=3400216 RepID=UPI003CF125E1